MFLLTLPILEYPGPFSRSFSPSVPSVHCALAAMLASVASYTQSPHHTKGARFTRLCPPLRRALLNATGQSRVTLSLRQAHLKSSLCAAARGKRPEFRPNTSQASPRASPRSWRPSACGTSRGRQCRRASCTSGRRSCRTPASPTRTSSPYFVPGSPHGILTELRQALDFVPG